MILLAGGTGRLGRVLVDRFVDRGLAVRILTRDPARAAHLAGEQVTVVGGDVRDRETLTAATVGASVVVSAMHGFTGPRANSPAAVDRDGNAKLTEAAKAAGAELVLMSTIGAAADSPMELFRMKYAAEERAAESGVPTTIVRAAAFLELWIELLQQTARRSGRPLVFGRGENPINFVSVTDVADLVERAVTDPGTRGMILEIGGPDNVTFDQLAQAVQATAGRSKGPRHVPRSMLHVVANSIGRVKPEIGRQASAALAMDREDLTFDDRPLRERYPDLRRTSLADLLSSSGSDRATVAAAAHEETTTG